MTTPTHSEHIEPEVLDELEANERLERAIIADFIRDRVEMCGERALEMISQELDSFELGIE